MEEQSQHNQQENQQTEHAVPPKPEQETHAEQPAHQPPTVVYPKKPFPWHRIVYTIQSVIELLFLFRLFFLMLGAESSNRIVQVILDVTDILVSPFVGIFPNTELTNSNVSIDWSTLAAMITYGLIAWVLGKIIQISLYRNR